MKNQCWKFPCTPPTRGLGARPLRSQLPAWAVIYLSAQPGPSTFYPAACCCSSEVAEFPDPALHIHSPTRHSEATLGPGPRPEVNRMNALNATRHRTAIPSFGTCVGRVTSGKVRSEPAMSCIHSQRYLLKWWLEAAQGPVSACKKNLFEKSFYWSHMKNSTWLIPITVLTIPLLCPTVHGKPIVS